MSGTEIDVYNYCNLIFIHNFTVFHTDKKIKCYFSY